VQLRRTSHYFVADGDAVALLDAGLLDAGLLDVAGGTDVRDALGVGAGATVDLVTFSCAVIAAITSSPVNTPPL
jgi:hypothetical protein